MITSANVPIVFTIMTDTTVWLFPIIYSRINYVPIVIFGFTNFKSEGPFIKHLVTGLTIGLSKYFDKLVIGGVQSYLDMKFQIRQGHQVSMLLLILPPRSFQIVCAMLVDSICTQVISKDIAPHSILLRLTPPTRF